MSLVSGSARCLLRRPHRLPPATSKRRDYASRRRFERGAEVRGAFLEFFVEGRGHRHVRSSPVVPHCDPTVPFVNAGMNQFKRALLGACAAPHARVANSQKCVRVGGKHNDLEAVGEDGTHHTFFEMLGNWSFGDYGKESACEMALKLLTDTYQFSQKDFVVTYFGGDKSQGLQPDLETKEIWLKLGFTKDQIIPCGMKDNFWEMGPTGPCGPCTEIHYRDRSGNMLEVWNIVFIEYNRLSDNEIVQLPKQHIDTGMGLERLTSILQNKTSNYDTDLFQPLIETIHKNSKDTPPYGGQFGELHNVDKAYRVLADHARMISICLADEVYPCSNLRLRNVLRKSILISKNVFNCPSNMMIALYDEVAKSLGGVYPELYDRMSSAKEILMHEEDAIISLQSTILKDREALIRKYPEVQKLPNEICPGFAEGYKQFKEDIKNIKDNILPGHLAFKLYDTFGLNENMIGEIARANNLSIEHESFNQHLAEHKARHKAIFSKTANANIHNVLVKKMEILKISGESLTNDEFKYDYSLNDTSYAFPPIEAKLIAILSEDGDFLKKLNTQSTSEHHLIFDKSNFYCEEGGQGQDLGLITFGNSIFKVNGVSKIQGFVLHRGQFEINKTSDAIKLSDVGKLVIDPENRLSLMQHHTATHLLNAAVKKVLAGSVTCQLGSKVTAEGLSLSLGVYGKKLSQKAANEIQQLIRDICSENVAVETSIIDSQKLLELKNVLTVPGEVYPDTGLRLVDIKWPNDDLFSRELCCGTHVLSTKSITDFAITNIKGASGHLPTIRAIAGNRAIRLRTLLEDLLRLEEEMHTSILDLEALQVTLKEYKTEYEILSKGEGPPYGALLDCNESLNRIDKKLKDDNIKTLTHLVQTEIETTIADNESSQKHYLVHFLACSYLLEPGSLTIQSAIRSDISKPALILGCANGTLKATCRVPEKCVNADFNAEKWISSIVPVFKTYVVPPVKGQDLNLVAHMKGKKVSLINCESLVSQAMKSANEFANRYYLKNVDNDEDFGKKRDCNS